MSALIGSHVELSDPFGGAAARDAHVVQVNLSAPQTWRAPSPRKDVDWWRAWEVPVYVHAPYLINPSSIKDEVRQKSKACLQTQVAAAAKVGARGVVVHGGHPTGTGTLENAIDGWFEVLSGWTPEIPVLIENTAGGKAGPARYVSALEQLWKRLSAMDTNIGFCLDTCHAHAGGESLDSIVERVLAVTGRIDLVHANDSKDPFGSGRDRHENLGNGYIGLEAVARVVADAAAVGAPAVVETPGGPEAMAADVASLRAAVAGM